MDIKRSGKKGSKHYFIGWWHFVINIKISKFRCKNHEELMETLKDVNQIIQQSARLRIGKSKVNPGKIWQ